MWYLSRPWVPSTLKGAAMSLKLRRLLPFFVALFFAFGQLPTLAQSVPCSAITRNPLVLEGLLDSHSNDEDMDVPEGTIHAAQLEQLQFTPIVIQPGDALYLEYRGRDFTISADFANGDRAAFDSSPRGSYEEWRRGILLLDGFRAGMKQRLVRLRIVGKEPGRVLLRNIRIIRAGRPVFEFARLASYGKPQVKKTVARQLPCVAFDEAPAANPAMVNYVVPNGLAPRGLSGDYLRPMLPPLPMITMQSTTGTDGNHYKFTGKEFDDESGLYNYGARYYGPALGRYISPDWAAKPVAVPYADFGNPQSLNLYPYGRNNPTTVADKDGHCPGDDCKKVHVTVTAPQPGIIQNAPVNGAYKSGVGTIATVQLTDKSGKPLQGVNIKEDPVTKNNLTGSTTSGGNPLSKATSANGTIQDMVIAPLRSDPQPHEVTPEDTAAMKDAANTLLYDRTTEQTLTFSLGKQECQCTYSETLSNVDSQGNLNTQQNSSGINFTITTTTPVVKRVEKDKEQK
jgi:RHS repeat-associated protein